MEPLSSRFDALPDDLVQKGAEAIRSQFPGTRGIAGAHVYCAQAVLAAIGLSSILRERDEAVEAARSYEDIARAARAGDPPLTYDYHARLEAAEGERDRLREAVEGVIDRRWTIDSPEFIARAALSTGDRQEQHLGVRTGVPTQPGIAGHKTEGGEASG